MPDSFKVVFNGARVAGIEEPALRGELLRLGFHERHVHKLLEGRRVTIKSKLSEEKAERYRQRLQAAGLITEVIADDLADSLEVAEPTSPDRGEPVQASEAPPLSPSVPESDSSGPKRRRSQIKFTGTGGEYFGIWIVNIMLLIVTLGFYAPWAKVRMARYRASCTEMQIYGDLDGFVAGEAQRAGAVGLELGDAFDVGISLI